MILNAVRTDLRDKRVHILFGLTGSGKTSLVSLLSGGTPMESSMCSDTKEPTVYRISTNELVLDTAGLLDNRETKGVDREILFNSILGVISSSGLVVGHVCLCFDALSRIPKEAADWFADVLFICGNVPVSGIITKRDESGWQSDISEVVKSVKGVLGESARIIEVGYKNTELAQKFLSSTSPSISLPKEFTSSAKLNVQLQTLRQEIDAMRGAISAAISTRSVLDVQLAVTPPQLSRVHKKRIGFIVVGAHVEHYTNPDYPGLVDRRAQHQASIDRQEASLRQKESQLAGIEEQLRQRESYLNKVNKLFTRS